MKQHNLIKNFINWLQWFLYVSSPVKIVEEKDDIDKINFIEIGLNLKTHYGTKYSLFNNLIDNRYISSNTWFLFYFKKH